MASSGANTSLICHGPLSSAPRKIKLKSSLSLFFLQNTVSFNISSPTSKLLNLSCFIVSAVYIPSVGLRESQESPFYPWGNR